MKKHILFAAGAMLAAVLMTGCGSKPAETTAAPAADKTEAAADGETKAEAAAEGEIPAPEGDDNKISIGVTPVPHAEIVNDVVVPKLEAAGWDVEVVEFNDYVQPSTALCGRAPAPPASTDTMARSMQTISRLSVIWKSRTRKEDFI